MRLNWKTADTTPPWSSPGKLWNINDKCAACGEPITVERVTYQGKIYHHGHQPTGSEASRKTALVWDADMGSAGDSPIFRLDLGAAGAEVYESPIESGDWFWNAWLGTSPLASDGGPHQYPGQAQREAEAWLAGAGATVVTGTRRTAKMTTCPHCGVPYDEWEATDGFCPHCDSPLSEPGTEGTEASRKTAENTPNAYTDYSGCARCGHGYNDHWQVTGVSSCKFDDGCPAFEQILTVADQDRMDLQGSRKTAVKPWFYDDGGHHYCEYCMRERNAPGATGPDLKVDGVSTAVGHINLTWACERHKDEAIEDEIDRSNSRSWDVEGSLKEVSLWEMM